MRYGVNFAEKAFEKLKARQSANLKHQQEASFEISVSNKFQSENLTKNCFPYI